jgi:fatty-acyl-CoA synthase
MGEQEMPLRTIQDLEAIEHVSFAARLNVHSTYQLIREAATQDPERMAIALLSGRKRSDQPARISYNALLNGLHQAANLLADLGIGSQDVIALLLPDLLETYLLFWGGQAAGIICPIDPWLPVEQIVALLQMTKAKMLVAPGPQVSQDMWHKAEGACAAVKSITTVLQVPGPGKERDGVYAFDDLLHDYPSDHLFAGSEITLDDIAIYFPTSNMNGTPRLVPLTHGNLLYAAWVLGIALTVRPEEVLMRGLSHFIQGWLVGG